MKKIISVLAGILLLITGLVTAKNLASPSGNPPVPLFSGSSQNTVPAVTSPAPAAAEPVSLVIPKLGIRTNIEPVGQDSQGNMGVPTKVSDVSWYRPGFRPGENGSAVLAGHLDDVTGAPAVFYNLNDLVAGDQIEVIDQNGKVLKFTVTGNNSYPYNRFPLQEVFGSTGKPMLNLITCGGVWDSANRVYSNRVVVYSELNS